MPNAIAILLADDAPQFRQITTLLALCWVHDGRHYKKLNPVIEQHKIALETFLTQYWEYYHRLLDYRANPRPELAETLEQAFNALFSTQTDYDQLDKRIQKTKFKKDFLLLALKYPMIPLHNNTSELGARAQARYRDISYHTMSEKGYRSKRYFYDNH